MRGHRAAQGTGSNAVGTADEQYPGQSNGDRKSLSDLRIRYRAAGRKLCRLFYKYPISHFLTATVFAKYPWYNMSNGGCASSALEIQIGESPIPVKFSEQPVHS